MASRNGKTLADVLDDYEYIGERLRGHQWPDPQMYRVREGRRNLVALVYTCRSCGMTRTDLFGSTGELEGRDYKRPSGYIIHMSKEERERVGRISSRAVAAHLVRSAAKESLPELPE